MTPGEIAYSTYCKKVEWKAFNDQPLPEYSKQDKKRKDAWEAAAVAVIAAIQRGDIKLI